MTLNPYLFFDGQCKEAFEFYQQVLGGEIVMMLTNGETPARDQMPPETHDRIAHVRLSVGDDVLMGSDAPSERYQKAQGIDVTLAFDSVAEAERVFNALAENGSVRMPFEKTFFAAGFGTTIDRFGTPWMVICERPT